MDLDIKRAIELIGDMSKIDKPVHYPQVRDADVETENYKWFVANDSGSGTGDNKIDPAQKYLSDIDQNTTQLPGLRKLGYRS